MIVHEELDIECAMPYHAVRLAPLPVLEMCGQSFDLEPKVKKEEAVWAWWQDLILKGHDSRLDQAAEPCAS